MKRQVTRTLTLLFLLLMVAGCTRPLVIGPAAAAKKAGAAFMTAATAGDRAKVQSLLAPSAEVTADEFIGKFQGMTNADAFAVIKAQPNQSGVAYLVQVEAWDQAHRNNVTTLAMRREAGVWVVLKAGTGFSY